MPLMKGKGQDVITKNISELVKKYNKTGGIGRSRPGSATKARKQAVAIAYSKAGKGK